MYKAITSTILLIFITAMSACSSQATKEAKLFELYEVNHDGRIHVFYDRGLYKSFMQVGETPFRLTRIAAGPNGETLVFGLTKQDKKMKSKITAIELFDGKTEAPSPFYAEMRLHDRIYVFDNFEDMNTVRKFGHPNYFYMQVGAGPKGETVVYVLNKTNKKKQPLKLMDEFRKLNS